MTKAATIAAVLGLLTAACGAPHPVSAAPRVVVTIAPIHSLAAAVMAGAGAPELLIPGGRSPHTYALKPSAARALSRADLVIRVDPGLETFLNKALQALAAPRRTITLTEIKGLTLLPLRPGGLFELHDGHEHGKPGAAHSPARGGHDPHIWLDPRNGQRIADHIARILGALDPAHAHLYKANAVRLKARLKILEQQIAAELAPVRHAPYIVFHDAYHYFEHRFGLSPAGNVTRSPEIPPGARRLMAIRQKILEARVRCVFAEPQFTPKLITTITAGTGAKQAILDPLGSRLPPGPDLYFLLLKAMAADIRACLQAAPPPIDRSRQ